MTPAIKVLLFEDNRLEACQAQHWLKAAGDGAFEVECVEQLRPGIERLAKGGFDIALLDLNLPDSRGLETFTRLHDRVPQVPIVVLTGEYDETIGPSAVEHGAQDYLLKHQADAASLSRVLRFGLARHRAQVEMLGKSKRGKSAKVLGFLGAKGGVGTTTIALNVAVALAAQNQSVILVELQAGFGTLSHHLQQEAVANLSNLLELPAERIDLHALENVLCRGPEGLRILFGPQSGAAIKAIEPEQAAAIVQGLSRMADFLIIDLPNSPTAATQAAVTRCHSTVLVTEREPSSIFCGKALVHLLHAWGVGGHLVDVVVVNRAIYPLSVEMSRIRSELDCNLIGSITSDSNACLNSQESGVPLVLSSPDHDISHSLLEITNRLSAEKVVSLAY